MIGETIVITDATVEPITTADAKTHLRVDTTDEDTYIEGLVKAARRYCEWRTGRTFHQTTLEHRLERWPLGDQVVLPRATPLLSVDSVKYLGSDGTEYTFSSSYYIADTSREPGRVVLGYSYEWPTLGAYYPVDPIRVRYTCGIANGSPQSYPADDIIHAMKLLIGHWYENREATVLGTVVTLESKPLLMATDALLANHLIYPWHR